MTVFILFSGNIQIILTVNVNLNTEKGMLADEVTIRCHAMDENQFARHIIKPGSSIICIGDKLIDVVYMDIDPEKIINGADGWYELGSGKEQRPSR